MKHKKTICRRLICACLSVLLTISFSVPVRAQSTLLPSGTTSVATPFVPLLLKGMTVDPADPFRLDFILDTGNAEENDQDIQKDSMKLVRYFLAAMTVPQEDLWVNLSPEDKDRIVPEALGKTDLGMELLEQDYLLKQLTAALMRPEGETGKQLWEKIYEQARDRFGASNIPVDMLNKVWIVPDTATVYENGATVYVVDSKLKVMLEGDYLERKTEDREQKTENSLPTSDLSHLSSEIIKEIVVPEIEYQVNNGSQFAKLRQIYHSLILAKWYKRKVRNSILTNVYADKNKVDGIEVDGTSSSPEDIYEKYLSAFRSGAYTVIKEDYDAQTRSMAPRKYFSGGFRDQAMAIDKTNNEKEIKKSQIGKDYHLQVFLDAGGSDYEILKGGKKGIGNSDYGAIQLVDEEGNVLEGQYAENEDAHREGRWHMTSHIYVFDPQGRLLLQKRSEQKKSSKGKLQVSASGHVDAGETPRDAALREGEEEIGIPLDEKRLIQATETNSIKRSYLTEKGRNNEFTTAYVYVLNKEEYQQVAENYNLNEIDYFYVVSLDLFKSMIEKFPDAFSRTLKFMVGKGRDDFNRIKEIAMQGDKQDQAMITFRSRKWHWNNLHNESLDQRLKSMRHLYESGFVDEKRKIEAMLSSSDATLRSTAEALFDINQTIKQAEEFAGDLFKNMSSVEVEETMRKLVYHLGYYGGTRAVQFLKKLLFHEDERFRSVASMYLRPEEVIAAITEKHGLDENLYVRFLTDERLMEMMERLPKIHKGDVEELPKVPEFLAAKEKALERLEGLLIKETFTEEDKEFARPLLKAFHLTYSVDDLWKDSGENKLVANLIFLVSRYDPLKYAKYSQYLYARESDTAQKIILQLGNSELTHEMGHFIRPCVNFANNFNLFSKVGLSVEEKKALDSMFISAQSLYDAIFPLRSILATGSLYMSPELSFFFLDEIKVFIMRAIDSSSEYIRLVKKNLNAHEHFESFLKMGEVYKQEAEKYLQDIYEWERKGIVRGKISIISDFKNMVLELKEVYGFPLEMQTELPSIYYMKFSSHDLYYLIKNLVANAVYAAQKDEKPQVSLFLDIVEKNGERYMLLSVKNNGEIISQENLEKIRNKEPFTTKGPLEGTGEGVLVVQDILSRYNGFLEVESSKEAGTVFRAYFQGLKEPDGNAESRKKDDALISAAEAPGGIDMKDIDIRQTGRAAGMIMFDSSAFEGILSDDVKGFQPVIINFAPVNDLLFLLGLGEGAKEPALARDEVSRKAG